MIAVCIASAAVIVVLSALGTAPEIIRALSDARLVRERADGEVIGFDLEEITLAVVSAIRRTDPDMSLELVERVAESVLEDLNAGVLTVGAEDDGPA